MPEFHEPKWESKIRMQEPPNITREQAEKHSEPGWLPLVYECYDLCDRFTAEHGGSYQVVQIKQKFAGLRFYVHFEVPVREGAKVTYPWDQLEEITARSYRMCEVCGGYANRATNGRWLRTLCAEHLSFPDPWSPGETIQYRHLPQEEDDAEL